MIKKRVGALLLTVLLGAASCAFSQTLPGVAVFSPGLVRLSEKMAENPAVQAEAEITVDHALYARDLSLLKSMLEGTIFRYAGDQETERLIIERSGEVLGDYALVNRQLLIDGKPYALDEARSALEQMIGAEIPGYETAAAGLEQLQGCAALERVPLTAVADFLEGFKTGDQLPFGFVVTEDVTLERTMSDDGTRLTRVDFLSGAMAREGEAPYVITGYMRQPAGRAPKDTFEIVIRQDDRNFMELSYSALRESTIKSKNKKGENSVRTSLKAAGKIAGSSISSRLTVTMTNAWAADGDALDERVTVSAVLTHQDNTPGRRMQRLNEADVKLRQVIRLTTHESGDEMISLTDDVTFSAVMDDNTFLDAGTEMRMTIGAQGEMLAPLPPAAQGTDERLTDTALQEAIANLAARTFRMLDQTDREKARKGL